MEIVMKTVTLVCETCNKEFEKSKGEYNRRIRLGKDKFYCGLSCSGKQPEQLSHLKRIRDLSDFDISQRAGNRADELSPFRETFRRLHRRGKEITITLESLKEIWDSQKGICPLTGWALELPTQSKNYKLRLKTASLDRIDNSKGYAVDNVRFVSVMFNFARNKFSDEDVIEFARAVTKTTGVNGIDR
jgi:hypothetical protein